MQPDVLILSDVHHVGFMRSAGPYRIATEISRAGFACKVVPILGHLIAIDKFTQLVRSLRPRVIGISTTFLSPELLKSLTCMLRECKATFPDIRIVVGGSHAGMLAAAADAAVYGYADSSVVGIIVKLLAGHEGIKHVYDKHSDHFDFSSSEITYDHIGIDAEVLPIEIARGCIFNCAFCSYPLNGKKKIDYLKGHMSLLSELTFLNQTIGTTSYMFVDDTLNDSTAKMTMLKNIFDLLPYQLTFTSYMRLDLLASHPEQIDLMQGHVASAFFGIESMDHSNAKMIGKGMAFMKQVETAWKIKERWKCHMTASFILGLPADGPAAGEQLLEFMLSNDNPFDGVHISPLSIATKPQIWSSKFESNPGFYGYDLGVGGQWVNRHTGLDRSFWVKKANEINAAYRPYNRYGCWTACALRNIGWNRFDSHPTLGDLDALSEEVAGLKLNAMTQIIQTLGI